MASKLTKSTKCHTEFEEVEPDYVAKLEVFDRRTNSNKFWRVWVYGQYVVRHSGRHGTRGLHFVHKAWSQPSALNAAEDLVREKRYKKGYADEKGVLDRIIREIN